MPSRDLDARCSRYFSYRDLIECGDTWERLVADGRAEPNVPHQSASWRAIEHLARKVLDPIRQRFGALDLTYGFASPALVRQIPSRVSPKVDQHVGCELNAKGELVCARRGQAVDFLVPGVSSFVVATWVGATLPFDRMYVYGRQRPLHVSAGPERNRLVFAMVRRGDRVLPRRVPRASEGELSEAFGERQAASGRARGSAKRS